MKYYTGSHQPGKSSLNPGHCSLCCRSYLFALSEELSEDFIIVLILQPCKLRLKRPRNLPKEVCLVKDTA